MKHFKSIILCALACLALGLTSCNDWLDINTDPNTPSAESTPYQLRLAHILFFTNSGTQFAAWRSNFACGDWTRSANNAGTQYQLSLWNPQDGLCTTSYQWWFVGAYCNVPDLYKKAMEDENGQYAGVARIIRAYGMMLMTDLYGEMPYFAVEQESALPEYNTGREIFMQCIEDVEEGISLLEGAPTLDPTKPALAEGDFWNNGDVNKWIKLGYFLKARWLNKLTKKAAGSYKDGKYDADEILRCLDKAMQSNADNTIVNHTDDNGATHDNLGWDEPVDYSPLFSVCGMNSGYMVTKMLYDNLTNFAGKGIEDPRADHIIPWAYSPNREENGIDAAGVKWNGHWRRSLGVDMSSEINSQGGPLRAMFNTTTNSWYINSANEARLGDTVYIEETSDCKGYFANPSILYCRAGSGKFQSAESGTFYTRVSSPTYIGTYAECCFIKAETLFKKGDKAGAYTAYKNGIKASMELMNVKLNAWIGEDPSLADCPSFTPITQEAMDNYLNNGIGTQAELTLGHILTQKRLALMFSYEIWNDMRRYDFDSNIFFGWSIPAYHYKVAAAMQAIPEGKQYRRWRQCSHEYNYNSKNLQAIGAQVPGARMTDSEGKEVMWNRQDDAWTIPVWWDSDQE